MRIEMGKLQRVMQWKVLFVSDDETNKGSHYETIQDALCAGAGAIIYRDKRSTFEQQIETVRNLLPLIKEYNACLFVCDNPYLVSETGADGVILGQSDIPVAVARDVLGPDGYIGLAVHHCGESAEALLYDADFLLMGPIDRRFGGIEPISMKDLSWTTLASRVPVFVYGSAPKNDSVIACLDKKARGVVWIHDPLQEVPAAVEAVVATVKRKMSELHPDDPCYDELDDTQGH